MTNKKKTNIDVFEAIIHMAMGQYGRVAVQEFRQTVLPKLKLSPFAYKELSDFRVRAGDQQREARDSAFFSLVDESRKWSARVTA